MSKYASSILPSAPLALLGIALSPLPMLAQLDYNRAERLLGWHTTPLLTGTPATPEWMEDGNRFWYRSTAATGPEFVLVSPTTNTRIPLFDNARLAAAMSLAADTAFDSQKLPFQNFRFTDETEQTIDFRANAKRFECHIGNYTCAVSDTVPAPPPDYLTSPDQQWEAFTHDYNLHIRPKDGGDSIQLTTDGEEYWEYGIRALRPGQIIRSQPRWPILEWSPDSKKIAVMRTDERNVPKLHLISSTSIRPKHYEYPYGSPGDSIVESYDIHMIDLEQHTNVRVQMEPQAQWTDGMNDSTWINVSWSGNSEDLYFTHHTRGLHRIQLMRADITSGEATLLVKDSSATYVEMNLSVFSRPNWRIANNGNDLIWFSERGGWGHLYRFDRDGNLKNQITSGEWTVGDLLHIDESSQTIYFTARGREPGRFIVQAYLYSVNFDGSNLQLLTPEEGDHTLDMSPTGRYWVDTYSTVTTPPVSVLRAIDGRVIRELETQDVSALVDLGWSPPEEFTVKARDGITDLYGVMYKPSHFDSTKQYPIVEWIYPGPFIGSVGNWNFNTDRRGNYHGLAELGFIVVQLDAMSTPFRQKAFQDRTYGPNGDNGLADHVTAIRQLAARHSFIDIDRVGIYGHSGGGFSSTGAILRYPDFYKVAVSSAGNHDNRTYNRGWGEKYYGLRTVDSVTSEDNYAGQANYLLAENLKGKLLLIHGDMDDNVHPAMTIRLVDALIKANKQFDMLIMPDRYHGLNEPYVIKRRWDYFVQHLLGEIPPADYVITRPSN